VFKPTITTNQLPQKEIQEKQDKPAKAAGQPDFNPCKQLTATPSKIVILSSGWMSK
jgi:hypothetical protein